MKETKAVNHLLLVPSVHKWMCIHLVATFSRAAFAATETSFVHCWFGEGIFNHWCWNPVTNVSSGLLPRNASDVFLHDRCCGWKSGLWSTITSLERPLFHSSIQTSNVLNLTLPRPRLLCLWFTTFFKNFILVVMRIQTPCSVAVKRIFIIIFDSKKRWVSDAYGTVDQGKLMSEGNEILRLTVYSHHVRGCTTTVQQDKRRMQAHRAESLGKG